MEQVFTTLIIISNPLDFDDDKIRESATKRLLELFHMNIWFIFGKPGINEFGSRYLQELDSWKDLVDSVGEDEVATARRQRGHLLRSHMLRLVVSFVQE